MNKIVVKKISLFNSMKKKISLIMIAFMSRVQSIIEAFIQRKRWFDQILQKEFEHICSIWRKKLQLKIV